MFGYKNTIRIQYEDGATFVPRCTKCGRFVKADETIMSNDSVGLKDQPNATCQLCGRTNMIFEGFM